jgi:copper chaperone CopZ
MTRSMTTIPVLALALLTACSEAPASDAQAPGPAAFGDELPAATLRPISLHVPDMSCALCARPIEKKLETLGVREVEANLETRWVTGRFDPERLTAEAIRTGVEDLLFRVAEVRID